jgi:hypothetical protein
MNRMKIKTFSSRQIPPQVTTKRGFVIRKIPDRKFVAESPNLLSQQSRLGSLPGLIYAIYCDELSRPYMQTHFVRPIID